MQVHQANTLEEIETRVADSSSEDPMSRVMLNPRDFSSPSREEVLALLKADGDRKHTISLVAGALIVGFVFGWAGGFAWYGPITFASLNSTTQTETPSRRTAETKSGRKTEGLRKTASTRALRTPPGASQISADGASISAKPTAAWSDGAYLSGDASSTPPAVQADITVTGSIAPSAPFMAATETRPTTIVGWTVLDVRGGTAVLGGPDGIRMATRGDTVPGIGRIDSIVRWGNRWIVATATGLISTP
ncbi:MULTISPECIES: hypothetical protein [unclassified Bradyrhizobium]|uniref:hypothetical protein n=1 Tax=unclassified Bradyrhizobium TaxID=2631580 RepID=UPI001FF86F71|nr:MULTISPECIES: hypothetical protein [unclassified Bradyrhizobium]MCK1712097.1 hypothetical protein [Bradyrhizobium sp. 143]MCK1732073.1 hypothetical protein [Bradyrhizobium sp. 142]